MGMRLTVGLALLAASLLLVVVLAGTASASVHAVYTDKLLYSLSDTATITVNADDGDVVSVQVSKRFGPWRIVVWNSSAKTIPMDSSDGDTGYVTFAWNISSNNSGLGLYSIRVFIGGDPTTGIPTPVRTFVIVAFLQGGGMPSSLGSGHGRGANAAYSLEELEDLVARGNITPEQEEEINRLFEGEGEGIPPSINGTDEPGSNETPSQPGNGGTGVGNNGNKGQSAGDKSKASGVGTSEPSGSEGTPGNIISTVLDLLKALFGV